MSYIWREGNDVELLINGEAYFPAVFASIRAAQKQVLLETFIIFEDKVGNELQQILIEVASRGVEVQVMVDGYGTADLSKPFVAAMTSVGVKLHMFDPKPKILGYRTNMFRRLHRKIVVVDGEEAFVGGINFSADHLADFGPMAKQDYAVRVTGPIVVDIHRASMDLFRQNREGGRPRRSLPAMQGLPRFTGDARMRLAIRDNDLHPTDIERQYLQAIRSANYRLVIANAYFFPGYRLMRELRNASRRGVDVTLILQGQPDMPWVRACAKLLYNYLLRDGVSIYEYRERPLHGKVALVDQEWATVGSSNLDPLSLSLNLEANLIIRHPPFNQELHQHLKKLVAEKCQQVSLETAMRGSWWRAPLTVMCFHFIRRFPAMAGQLPAHVPMMKLLRPHLEPANDAGAEPELQLNQEKTS